MKLKETLMHKCALSEQGAKDMCIRHRIESGSYGADRSFVLYG